MRIAFYKSFIEVGKYKIRSLYLSRALMFLFLHKGNVMMNTCCSQRKFFSALPPLVPRQLPSRMESHFWYILPDEVKSASLLDQYLELLSPSEKENVFRMRDHQLRKRALLARALVRTTIARYLTNYQIGIDVEEKQRKIKHDILTFAKRYFSPGEVKILAAITNPEVQRREFIKLWTLKEAYVKALGRGFSAAPFKTFTIRPKAITKSGFDLCENLDSEASEIIIESSDDPTNITSNWSFELLELDGSHYGAICTEKYQTIQGEESIPMKFNVWKTIPFVEDECVSDTVAVRSSIDSIRQL